MARRESRTRNTVPANGNQNPNYATVTEPWRVWGRGRGGSGSAPRAGSCFRRSALVQQNGECHPEDAGGLRFGFGRALKPPPCPPACDPVPSAAHVRGLHSRLAPDAPLS